MYTPSEIEAMPQGFDVLYRQLQDDIMTDIVGRIDRANQITGTADQQIKRLYDLGASKEYINEHIKNTLSLSDEELNRVFENFIKTGYARDASVYKAAGKSFIPYSQNRQLQQLVSAVAKQTKGEFYNITQSLGFAVKQADGSLRFKPIAKYYQDTLDRASMQLLSGAFDYNTVIKRAVAEMTNSGLRTVDYATGYSNRVDVAARRAVLTGFNQVTAKVNEENAKRLGTDMFEVSRHGGHRPEHWWGGRWYTYKQLQTVCGLGRVDGLCGANCYHSYSPVIPGISQPTYSADELERLEAEEKVKHTYMGKEYTKYEALQKQRRMETTMRAQRQQIKLLEGIDAEEALGNAKARYFAKSDEYVKFSRAMGLPQQRERITVDGLGKIKRDKTVANSSANVIINIVTQNGIKATYVSKHLLERCEQRNISINDISNALTQPLHINEVIIDNIGRQSQRFIGEKATVNINPQTGSLITAWKTGKNTAKKYR